MRERHKRFPRSFRSTGIAVPADPTYEIVELDPGQRLVIRTAEGPFPMETTYEWEPAARGGTTMRLRNRGQPSGFSKLAAPMMEAAMRRANRKDLGQLKALLKRR